MSRLEEIKHKYLGTYLLKENRNEDLLWLISRVEKAEKLVEALRLSLQNRRREDAHFTGNARRIDQYVEYKALEEWEAE